jgi:hypothetical protein
MVYYTHVRVGVRGCVWVSTFGVDPTSPGNHEYYQSTRKRTVKVMRELAAERDNLHVLFQEHFQLSENVRVLGTTLWSQVDRRKRAQLEKDMSDFRQISQDNEDEDLITVDVVRR